MYKKFLVLCIVASMSMLIGCGSSADTPKVGATNEDIDITTIVTDILQNN